MNMEQNEIGDILYALRSEKNVRQEKLCYGLCSKGNYSKYEYGNRTPDRLLLNAFFQRLGKNPDKLATVLSMAEYNYFCWKKKVLAAVVKENVPELTEFLEAPEAVSVVVNRNIQTQFLYQMQAVLAARTWNDTDRCVMLLHQAVELTMPGILERGMKGYLISVEEMEILLNLARYLIKGEQEKKAKRLLLEIAWYTEQHYDDYETKIKIYPRTVKLLIPLLLKENRNLEGMILCKKAIDLLRWQGVLYDLAELMEFYLRCGEGMQETEDAIRYKKQLKALREVYREYGADKYQTEHTLLSYTNREIYLMDEVIRRSRTEKYMSQEILSEDICTPETMSRIETGKRAPNPKNFRALMEKLDTELDYYNGELYTGDFLVLEKKLELERAISLKHWEEAQKVLEYLKIRLDMTHPKNQRIIEAEENCILYNTGMLGSEEFLSACERAAGCEKEGWREERFWNQFFTRYKVRMMNYIAGIYRLENQVDKAIFILEHLLERFTDSKVRLADRYKSSMAIIANLSAYYGRAGNFDKCIKMCDLGIELCLESGREFRLGRFLANKAEAANMQIPADMEANKRFFEQAYYISDMVYVYSTAAYVDKYYRDFYDEKMIWY